MLTDPLHEEPIRHCLDLHLARHLVNRWPTATARRNRGIETISGTMLLTELLPSNGLKRPTPIHSHLAIAMEMFVHRQAVLLIEARILAIRNPKSHLQHRYLCRLITVQVVLLFLLHLLVLVADPPLPTVVHETTHMAALHPIVGDVRHHHRLIMAHLVSILTLASHHLTAMPRMALARLTTAPRLHTKLLTVLHHLFARTTAAPQHIHAPNASTT